MRRLLPLLVVLALVAAACGGSKKKVTTSTSAAPDPGKAAVHALLHAAARNDAGALWNLSSKPSQTRLGPTLSAFRSRSARDIERTLRPFDRGSPTPFISQSVSQQFGLVAIRSGTHAFAFPLRRENGSWKVEWAGPVRFQILGPQPGSRSTVAQIGVEVRSPGVLGDANVFVDVRRYSRTSRPRRRTRPSSPTSGRRFRPACTSW